MRKEISESYIKENVTVNSEGCWEWNLYCNYGYGIFSRKINGRHKNFRVHKVMYELKNGKISDDKYVCHKCDNRKCCNPEHLFLGTAQDNTDDMISKGRGKFKHLNKGGIFHSRKVFVNGIEYPTMTEAGNALNISANGVKKRVIRGVEGYSFVAG